MIEGSYRVMLCTDLSGQVIPFAVFIVNKNQRVYYL